MESEEVITIPSNRIERVLWSEEEFDGIQFDTDEGGVTVVYAYGLWSFHLFLLALAKEMGPSVEPDRDGYQQIYHTLAELTMDMPLPVPAPERGEEYFSCKMPRIRVEQTR